jgi:hypothetical protein
MQASKGLQDSYINFVSESCGSDDQDTM